MLEAPGCDGSARAEGRAQGQHTPWLAGLAPGRGTGEVRGGPGGHSGTKPQIKAAGGAQAPPARGQPAVHPLGPGNARRGAGTSSWVKATGFSGVSAAPTRPGTQALTCKDRRAEDHSLSCLCSHKSARQGLVRRNNHPSAVRHDPRPLRQMARQLGAGSPRGGICTTSAASMRPPPAPGSGAAWPARTDGNHPSWRLGVLTARSSLAVRHPGVQPAN